ncbi:uncharacterized protein TNCV_869571 [Trichonephila clavipes]|nr:uncharacterized protein TNCV_869571 [Trichonephila clavipes]
MAGLWWYWARTRDKSSHSPIPIPLSNHGHMGFAELLRGGSNETTVLSYTRAFVVTDHVILNHGQVTWMTPGLAPPLLTTTPHQRNDLSALDRLNVHRCLMRPQFS